MKRAKDDLRRVVSVHLRLTLKEAEQLIARAKKARQTLSSWVRTRCGL
jgi:hypothetical protein